MTKPANACGGCGRLATMVNHPPHYKVGAFECIDAIEALGLDYHLGCVLKYIWRAGRKGDVLEDLRKARWYLDRAIERPALDTRGGEKSQRMRFRDLGAELGEVF